MKLAFTALVTLSCGGLAWAQTQPQVDTPPTEQSQGGTIQTPSSPMPGQRSGITSPSTMPAQPGTSDTDTRAGTGSAAGSNAAGTAAPAESANAPASRDVTVDLKTENPPPQDPRAAREEAEAALRYARTEGCRNAGSRQAQRECVRQAQSEYREVQGQSSPLHRSRH
jgi:hypothetical protein